MLKGFFLDESGATAIEYALIGGLVSLAIIISMGATTSLSINILNVHHSNHIPRYNTSLIKIKSKLLFCLGFVLEVLPDRMIL